jgi:hypothetical protein
MPNETLVGVNTSEATSSAVEPRVRLALLSESICASWLSKLGFRKRLTATYNYVRALVAASAKCVTYDQISKGPNLAWWNQMQLNVDWMPGDCSPLMELHETVMLKAQSQEQGNGPAPPCLLELATWQRLADWRVENNGSSVHAAGYDIGLLKVG